MGFRPLYIFVDTDITETLSWLISSDGLESSTTINKVKNHIVSSGWASIYTLKAPPDIYNERNLTHSILVFMS